MLGPFALIDRSLNRSGLQGGSGKKKPKGGSGGGYPSGSSGGGRRRLDLNDPKSIEYLRRMHPDFDEFVSSADVDYRTQCHTDANFGRRFRMPPVLESTRSLQGHSNSVDAVCWGMDPDTIISGSHDATLKVWDLKRGACIETLSGQHSAGIYHCASLPKQQLLVSCGSGQEKNLLLWKWSQKNAPASLKGHSRSVVHASFSADGQRLASAAQDGGVIVHDVERQAQTLQRTPHLGSALCTSFCASEPQLLVTGGLDGSIQFLDLRTEPTSKALLLPSAVANRVQLKTNLSIAEAHDRYAVHCMEFLDRETLFSGGADHKLKRWDLRMMAPFKPACAAEYLGHTAPVRSLAVGGEGKTVVTGCEDGSLRVWPSDPLHSIQSQMRSLRMHIKDLDTDANDFGRSAPERAQSTAELKKTREALAALRREEEQLVRENYVPASCMLNGHLAQVSGCLMRPSASGKGIDVVSSSWDQTLRTFFVDLSST
mmetsp:Transcript_51003/g.108345  ORF Transcript_51003/g.108345 Transcript_51003/m.108345 type:complete len:485 (+) Transcript_51003:242-1696(+)|eukprot:CAMPEP_0206447976 /NCGR_PEP_ID=MMETSP0324_2-20121206/17160_1 /ASSEMBLY_ACC=CAM_ASM_000836 /TAXON_ID=2866 /ORGANISM="Crypthecodinium cohnii, Strain Seligo" /LENGTH=484 /DNA_ID=CAMNT_0053916957 /DNA_START=173 /DNA_END=1627 /DNA_ORIENTATION=-